MEQQPPKTIGPYELLEPLGHGGMGVVWRARHRQSGRLAALKTVRVARAGMLHSIRREIHALAQLRHPGIVRIFDEGLHEGMPWYAMELIEGATLRHWSPQALAAPESPEPAPGASRSASGSGTERSELQLQSSPQSRAPGPSITESLELGSPMGASAAQPIPDDLRPVLSLVRRLCHVLSYLHGEGIVHRDLKPDNILIRASSDERRASSGNGNSSSSLAARGAQLAAAPWPVLVDFGLVSRSGAELSRDALEPAGQVSGTVAYMAPEQGRGEMVDARADLYALGCILYELVTGRPPFLGQGPVQVLYQHFEVEPLPPSRLRPEIPPGLEQLILGLLQKEPRKRLGYADDVSAALGRLGIEGDPSAKAPSPRAYLYRPGFSGRQDVLEALKQHLSALHSRSGAVILVEGESGVGKTRLLVELSQLAVQGGIRVLTGECLPGVASRELRVGSDEQDDSPPSLATRGSQSAASVSGPLQAFRKVLQVIADRCREHGALETQRLLGNRGKVLAAYEPSLAGLPGQEALAGAQEVAPLPPEAARLRLFSHLAETLSALAGGGVSGRPPLLVLLDDLQWADELSLAAVEFLARAHALAKLPLLLIATYRAEEVEIRPAGGGVQRAAPLSRLIEAPGVERLLLGRLDRKAVARIVGDMLGLSLPPEGFASLLQQQSEGNPFFVAEYLRAAVEGGVDGRPPLLCRNEAGRWQATEAVDALLAAPGGGPRQAAHLPLPRSLLELVSARLSRLSPDAQQLVEALSVLGREADGALLADVSGLRSSSVMKATLEALSRQVLEPTEGEGLRFVHDKLREVAYSRLGPERRLALHRAAAEGLEVAFAEQKDKGLGALASHWEQGGEPERARPLYLAAARQARDRYAWAEAEAHYQAYLRLALVPSAETVRARIELSGEVLEFRGESRQAIEEQTKALEQARGLGALELEGEVLGCIGNLYRIVGQDEQGRACLEQALDLLRQTGNRQGEGMVLGSLAALHQGQGRFEEARPLAELALDIHRQAGDRSSEGMVLGNLAQLCFAQDRIQEAWQLFEQALSIARQASDRRNEGIVLGNLASLHYKQNQFEEVRPLCEQALVLLRQVGDRRFEGMVLGQLAMLYHEQGPIHEARPLYELALATHRQVGDLESEAVALCSHATLERQAFGQLDVARQMALQAESMLRQSETKLWLAFGLCEQGHLALAEGRSGRASLDEAEALAEPLAVQQSSRLDKALGRLRRAQQAFDEGGPGLLFRGELAEDLPAGLRRWLAESGQL